MSQPISRGGPLAIAVLGILALVATLLAGTPAQAQQTPSHLTTTAGASQAPAAPGLVARIKALPGVTKVTEKPAGAGFRYFDISFKQPVDHRSPKGRTFVQRVSLLHRSTARPMVMYTSGYYGASGPFRSEPTALVDGNQLEMEYRFFEPSRPGNPDWEKQLTIWQAATDQHRIIQSFQRLYKKKWLTTGGSKGGMTATYHRRFYPADVSGTIPYVAPNDVVDTKDAAYDTFLDSVGPQACRADLAALQRRVLGADRQWFLDKFDEESQADDLTYEIVGDPVVAFESGVVDAYFAFWQYSSVSDCASVPDADSAGNQAVWNWFASVSPLTWYADQSVGAYTPYYFQAAYQMGSPKPFEKRLGGLLEHPGANTAITFVPDDLKPSRFDKAAMPDIDRWVRTKSKRMLYVYGGNDPWSAEAFTCGKKAAKRQCARFYEPGGNHGSSISGLRPAQRAKASTMVLRWAGLRSGDRAYDAFIANGEPTRIPALDKQPDYARNSRTMP